MVFNCTRCSKSFTTKWNLKRHTERKKQCISVETATNITTEIVCNPTKRSRKKQCISVETATNITAEIVCNPTKCNGKCNCNPTKCNRKCNCNPIVNESVNLYICIYCSKSYNNRKSKYKHQVKCQTKNENMKKEDTVDNIKEIIKKIKNTDKTLIIKNNEIKLIKTKNVKSKDTILNTMSSKLLTKKIKEKKVVV